ncbi:MAG: rhodanese-like domain-containing protein [Gammaproteobacteria bacterium]|nr:rhodanese-like domain-containing protein [Gammaproteobacteria bacterium]
MTNQIIQFIQNHWMLFLAAVVVIALLIFEEIKGKLTGLAKLSAQDAVLLLNRESAIVIDMRNQKAFGSGHILGAMNIARSDIDHNAKKLEPHKNQTVILVDDYDTNTAPVATKLRAQGFTKICVLAGGLNSWKTAQLPLTKD